MFTLMLIVLLSNGNTYDLGSREFPTRDRCEGYRESMIIQANAQDNMWLISSCEGEKEPVRLGIFFKEKKVSGDKT